MTDMTLSAEAQAMVAEGMRLAKAVLSAGMHLGVSDKPTAAELDLRAHLERMAAMAAPQPVAREPLNSPSADQMLDWLESMANKPGGLLLHSEQQPNCVCGLGLGSTGRTLRQAVADALGLRIARSSELAQGEQP